MVGCFVSPFRQVSEVFAVDLLNIPVSENCVSIDLTPSKCLGFFVLFWCGVFIVFLLLVVVSWFLWGFGSFLVVWFVFDFFS